MIHKCLSPLESNRGQGMAEYIIIVILVAIIVLVGIRLFGGSVINQFNNATNEIDSLESDGGGGALPGTN